MSKYKPTIGLEIHAELKTQTKMFCGCKNDSNEIRPNINVCPICLGHPGTLPAINKEAVKHVLKVGISVEGNIARLTEFDRKNYFYPDIPKGYQISQYKYPIVSGGSLAGVKIIRVHLEEDTGTSKHDRGEYSLVDFNRAGVPLMELVTEPVINSAESAAVFAKELQLLLRYLNVADANMEKGEMRVEANVSVSTDNKLGTKVEVKNLNSFKAVEKAIKYEINRQTEILESGDRVIQETRGWDEIKGVTFSQRQKEDSHDYRYFPDPDLPKLDISKIPDFDLRELKRGLHELPEEKRKRLKKEFDIKESDVEFYIGDRELADFFEECARHIKNKNKNNFQLLSNYIVSDLSGRGDEYKNIRPDHFALLIGMLSSGVVSSAAAKKIIDLLPKSLKDPSILAEENNLLQKSDEGHIESIVEEVILQNKIIVEEYKKGKITAIQFLIGQGMKLSKGSANPEVLKKVLESKLNK